MDGEHCLKSFAADEHTDAMLMVQMDTIPTDYFAAHHDYHADRDSGFSSSMKLLSNNSSANRNCYQENNEAKMVSQFYDHRQSSSSNLNGHPVAPYYIANSGYGKRQASSVSENENNSIAAMREMIFRIAAMQPIRIDPESVKPAKRRNVKISKDPQSVAARHRRERIIERIRILQRLVPGGIKMDTASMLDEAVHYMNFLKTQVQSLEKGSRH